MHLCGWGAHDLTGFLQYCHTDGSVPVNKQTKTKQKNCVNEQIPGRKHFYVLKNFTWRSNLLNHAETLKQLSNNDHILTITAFKFQLKYWKHITAQMSYSSFYSCPTVQWTWWAAEHFLLGAIGGLIYKPHSMFYSVGPETSEWDHKVMKKVFAEVTEQISWDFVPPCNPEFACGFE